ncbi:MAG: amidohydrolase [Betaproteobacteria bacterium RIFCSPLOWO2_12_FULL_62_13b]|nr:MAG: amidohydrolase [Betaproteobacteria bacterium RIFCSPLOWO2_12_FULL_62_13b]
MPRARAAWWQQTTEEMLDPGLAICDTHHHFWDHGPADRYLFDELLEDVNGGHNIVSSVFVECSSMYRRDGAEELKPVGEIEFVNGLAAMSASGQYGPARLAAGIVGYADLLLGAGVARVLEAHLAASPARFRGIRYWTTWDEKASEIGLRHCAPRDVMRQPAFREGLACLPRYRLAYDAWMLFHQLPELVDLARALPDLTFVMEHVGGLVGIGPYSNRDEVLEVWKRNVASVASCPNVVVKLGGLGTGRLGYGWQDRPRPPSSAEMAETWGPYCLYCIEQFGPERCMFESNFPVDGSAASYHVIWNTFKRITQGFSPAEKRAMYLGTAERVYRLGA